MAEVIVGSLRQSHPDEQPWTIHIRPKPAQHQRSGGWPNNVMPRDIASVLGISDKTVRRWLRANHAAGHLKYQRWVFTPAEADEIVTAHRARRSRGYASGKQRKAQTDRESRSHYVGVVWRPGGES
jgi:hypothetical protein